MEELASSAPDDPGPPLFERAAAYDSTGFPEKAVALYREALACGLTAERRRRAKIQLASSLRNLGREREELTMKALAPHLPRHQRSLANYAEDLMEPAVGPS